MVTIMGYPPRNLYFKWPRSGKVEFIEVAEMCPRMIHWSVASSVVLMLCVVTMAQAGDNFDKGAVEKLVAGNTAEMNLDGKQQSRFLAKGHYRAIKFFTDGRLEQRTARGKGSITTETGSWRVESDGRLCISTKDKREKCRAVKSTAGRRYELYNDKGERKAT